MTLQLTEKQRIERETFDQIVKDKTQGKSLLVSVAQPSFADYNGDLFFGAVKKLNFKNKRILEIGCGSGEISAWFALNGAANVVGIDISPESIRLADQRKLENNLSDKLLFMACPGEAISAPDSSVEMIFINVALHHLELEPALNECKRLLVPGGVFVAIEPLVRSRRLQNLRESTIVQRFYPIRQESSTEKILTLKDIDLVQKTFGNLKLEPYRIFSPFIYKAKLLFNLLAKLLFHADDLEHSRQKCNRFFQDFDISMLRAFPCLKIASRYSIVTAVKNDAVKAD